MWIRFAVTFVSIAWTAAAQNYAVRFNAGAEADLPYYWPVQVQPIGKSTEVKAPMVLLTEEQLREVKTTNAVAYAGLQAAAEIARSNALWQATAPARAAKDKVAALVATNVANAAAKDTLLAQVSGAGNVAGLKVVFTNLVKQVDANTQLLKELGDALKKLYEQQQQNP